MFATGGGGRWQKRGGWLEKGGREAKVFSIVGRHSLMLSIPIISALCSLYVSWHHWSVCALLRYRRTEESIPKTICKEKAGLRTLEEGQGRGPRPF